MDLVRFGLAAIAAAFWSLPALGQTSPPPSEWIEALRAGGHVIVMPHATTYQDQADTEPLNFGNRNVHPLKLPSVKHRLGRSRTESHIGELSLKAHRHRSRPMACFPSIFASAGWQRPQSWSGLAASEAAAPRAGRWRAIHPLLLCGFLVAAAVAAGAGVMVANLHSRALADRERELGNIALVLAEQTDRTIQALELVQTGLLERMQALGTRSGEELEQQMSGHDMHLMLKDGIRDLPHVEGVAIFSAQGKLINFSRSWPVPSLTISDRDHFKAFASDGQQASFVSEPFLNRTVGTRSIIFARRLTGPAGEFLGLISVEMALQHLEELFERITLGNGTVISLFRRDGVRLVRQPPRDDPGHSYGKGALFKNVLAHAEHGAARLNGIDDGVERLIAGHNVPHYPLVVTVGATVTAVLAEWRVQAIYMIATAVLLMLVIGATALLGIRQIKSYELRVKAQAEKDQKLRLDTALNNMSLGLCMFDSDMRLVLCNQRYIQMYGLAPEAVKPGRTLRQLIDYRKDIGSFAGDPEQYCAEIFSRVVLGKAASRSVETTDGRTIHITNQPMPGGGCVVTHEDITERRRAEVERDRSRELLNLFIENVPVTIFVKDAVDRRFVLVNRACETDWGLSRSEIIGKTAYDIFPKAAADVINERDERLLQCPDPLYFDEHSIQMPHTGERIVTSKRLLIRSDDGKQQYLAGIVEDITDRRLAEERIARLAHFDSLTDLPNRVLFCDQLDQALAGVRRGERLAMLYIDLDHFKRVNDTLGHPVGDALLKCVADRLRACIREIDLVGRLGGDEFAVIQRSLDEPSDAAALATRIRKAIKAPCELDGHKLVIDASIGVSIAPDDSSGRDQLMKNADLALYGAKGGGRGTYCFYEPGMDAGMKARQQLETDLQNALADGEFELYYQPVVDLHSNRVVGCEALLRWSHPGRGMIAPAEFIAIAEESGLIIPIGEWVLRRACSDAAAWPNEIKVAVNLSAVQLTGGKLTPTVIGALAESGLAASRLELEITETVLMQNTFANLATLHQLHDLGVRIAMDDFGIGYSSLSYLRSFPFDNIKIDRSFIEGISEKDDCVAIVTAVTSMARGLNMTTTAEGIETEQEREKVRELGCTDMQGYLFSRPRPVEEIVRLFLTRVEARASAA